MLCLRGRLPLLINAINRGRRSYCLIDCGIVLRGTRWRKRIYTNVSSYASHPSWMQLAGNFFNMLLSPQLVANLATLTAEPFGQQSTRKERIIKAPLCSFFERVLITFLTALLCSVHVNRFKYSNSVGDIDLSSCLNQCRCGDTATGLFCNVVTRIWRPIPYNIINTPGRDEKTTSLRTILSMGYAYGFPFRGLSHDYIKRGYINKSGGDFVPSLSSQNGDGGTWVVSYCVF